MESYTTSLAVAIPSSDSQSNIAVLRQFVESGGRFELPVDRDSSSVVSDNRSSDVDLATGEVSPQSVTRGLSLRSESIPGSDAFGSCVLVDWLSFTIPVASVDAQRSNVYGMLSMLGGGDDLGKGYRGYTRCYTVLSGSGRVAFHPDRLDMGVHVDLPSSALKLLDGVGILGDIQEFLEWVLSLDCKISRLDLAIDTDKVTIETIRDAICGDTFVSRCVWVNEHRFLRGRPGATVYVGSPSADRRVRFYDKAAEQGINTKESLEKGIPPIVWTRAEIQNRDKYARRAAVAIVQGVIDPVAFFNEIVDFREVTGDKNVSRRPRCDWWASWLGACRDRVGLSFERVEKTVGKVFSWLQNQVAPSLAMLSIASPEIRGWLHVVIDEGFTRLDNVRRDKAHRFHKSGLSLVPVGGV